MKTAESILVIDSDANLRRGAESALRGLGNIRMAGTSDETMAALREGGPYSVVVTTLGLPGMQGSMILEWVRELHPESVRVLMVAKEGIRCVSDAINDAGAFRVLVKPFTGELLRHAVKEAQAEHARILRERETLEGTMHGSLEAIAGMLAVVQPAAFGRAARLRRMVTLLAEKIGLPDKWDIQIAALLSQFGAVALPAELVERLCRNQPITAVEHGQLLASIEATLNLLQPIPRMGRVCQILRGIDIVPSRESGRCRVHTGDAERVLTLALDFDGLFAEHGSASEALRVMESRIGHYHAPYFDALRELVGARNGATLIDTPLADVRIGQFFAADVRSPNDLLLVARGQPVTPPLLFLIRNAWNGFAAFTMVRMVEPQERQPTPQPLPQILENERAA
ncbi:MAG: HD domain-containing phosphohydrolase [Gemmatimonadaceae bacterium]